MEQFKWEGVIKPKTTGIWLWSEIFTHDFKNGEKVAIFLLNTQGIFDNENNFNECQKLFAINSLLSSVQCFNVKGYLQKNDLKHFELFNKQSNQTTLQKLIITVQDWHRYQTNYGYYKHEDFPKFMAIEKSLINNTAEIEQRINWNFNEIGAFLLPSAGKSKTKNDNFGNLNQIYREFLTHVKELVTSIFAPDNLLIKKLNGHELNAISIIHFLEEILNIINDNSTILNAKSIQTASNRLTKCDEFMKYNLFFNISSK